MRSYTELLLRTCHRRNVLDVRAPGPQVSEVALRNNVSVALRYIAAWLGGPGPHPALAADPLVDPDRRRASRRAR